MMWSMSSLTIEPPARLAETEPTTWHRMKVVKKLPRGRADKFTHDAHVHDKPSEVSVCVRACVSESCSSEHACVRRKEVNQ